MNSITLHQGDVRQLCREYPDNHFHCVITSPPYYGLRDYGLEPLVWGGREDCNHIWGSDSFHPGPQELSFKTKESIINDLRQGNAISSVEINIIASLFGINSGGEHPASQNIGETNEEIITSTRKGNSANFINGTVSIKHPPNKIGQILVGNTRKFDSQTFFGRYTIFIKNISEVYRPKLYSDPCWLFRKWNNFSRHKINQFLILRNKVDGSIFPDTTIGDHQPQNISQFPGPRSKEVKVNNMLPGMEKSSTGKITKTNGTFPKLPSRSINDVSASSAFNLSASSSIRTGKFSPRHRDIICQKCGAIKTSFGLEPALDCLGWATGTPCGQCYICHSLEIYREIWRVLRDDGTFWLNIGDSYNTGGGKGKNRYFDGREDEFACGNRPLGDPRGKIPGLKPKDLCGVPFRLALALQAQGWYLRSDIIWSKPNPMPESCTDRPTKAHEYLFLLTKKPRYFWDQEAVKERCQSGSSDIRKMIESKERIGGHNKVNDSVLNKASRHTNIGQKRSVGDPSGRNLRSVWTIATQPFPGEYCTNCRTCFDKGWRGMKKRPEIEVDGKKEGGEAICPKCGSWQDWIGHFATFGPELARRCIEAGTSERGCCPKCGAPWERVVEKKFKPQEDVSQEKGIRCAADQKKMDNMNNWGGTPRGLNQSSTTGWRPTCSCSHTEADLQPCRVLDPFSGSGTTCETAAKLGQNAVGFDLNPHYIEMSRQRLTRALGMLCNVEVINS